MGGFSEQNLKGFIAAADDSTREVGRDIILNGGNAADAMAAMILNETVVMPSRVSLSGGGVCQIYDNKSGKVATLDFLPIQVSQTKATLPNLPRGVFSLQNKYGVARWSDVVAPAITHAQKGVLVSSALEEDIQKAYKLPASWKKLKKGDLLIQKNLAQTLLLISSAGAGIFYKGTWADEMSEAAYNLGYPYTSESLKTVQPLWAKSDVVTTPTAKVFFPNSSTLSHKSAQVWKRLISEETNQISKAKDMLHTMESQNSENNLHGIGLLATDQNGLTVVCSVSMGNLFGDGMFLKDQGFFLSNGFSYDQAHEWTGIIQTNPDETDVFFAFADVGAHAEVNALRFMQSAILDKRNIKNSVDFVQSEANSQQENLKYAPVLVCPEGYPNQVSSCQINNLVSPVYDEKTLKSN